MSRARQSNAERRAFAGEEGVGHLDQDARTVPGVDLAPAGPAVQEVLQHLQGLADDGVGLSPLHVDDEPDAARVVLESGVIERGELAIRHCVVVLVRAVSTVRILATAGRHWPVAEVERF
jgi:hypothetical protein